MGVLTFNLVFLNTYSYKVIDEVNLDQPLANTFLHSSRKPRSTKETEPEKPNEELHETCILQKCTQKEHHNLEFWEEQFEPARVHAEEKTEEKGELMESQAEFSESHNIWNNDLREKFYMSVLDEIEVLRNSSWTKLRNNCDWNGGCNKDGTEKCVQKWNERTCFCIEGYYGVNCEKCAPCACKKTGELVESVEEVDDKTVETTTKTTTETTTQKTTQKVTQKVIETTSSEPTDKIIEASEDETTSNSVTSNSQVFSSTVLAESTAQTNQ